MKEQTKIEEVFEVFDTNGTYSKGSMIVISIYDLQRAVEERVKQKQLDLINDIKQKVMKLEETTTITDFPFDLLHLLKSIEPIKK